MVSANALPNLRAARLQLRWPTYLSDKAKEKSKHSEDGWEQLSRFRGL